MSSFEDENWISGTQYMIFFFIIYSQAIQQAERGHDLMLRIQLQHDLVAISDERLASLVAIPCSGRRVFSIANPADRIFE